MTELKTISPGSNRSPVDRGNTLREQPWCGKINVRGNPENGKFIARLKSVLALNPPLRPNTCESADGRTCYCLGPDEWLIHCDIGELANLISQLKDALSGMHSAVVDVTDYYTVLLLEGPDAVALLTKACPFDLHPGVFAKDCCTQTRFAHASIMLHKISNTPGFRIQVRWSFTEYVWDYMVSAMKTL